MITKELLHERNLLQLTQKHHSEKLLALDNPSGILLCQKHGNGYRWRRRYLQNGRAVTVELHKTEKQFAEKLAVNLYRMECIEFIQKQIDCIDNLMRSMNSEVNSSMLTGSVTEVGRGGILTEFSLNELLRGVRNCPRVPADFFHSKSPYRPLIVSHLEREYSWIINWYLGEFDQSKDFPENLQFKTKLGFKVRSKSEVMEADRMFEEGILFHYEEKVLQSKEDYPDFYIPITYVERYAWEHFGALDKDNYHYRTKGKLMNYMDQRWFPGISLIMTSETKQHPLSEEQVDHQIRWLKERYRIAFPDLPPDESFNMYDLAAVEKYRRSRQ